MSGGHFNYIQRQLPDIAEEIQVSIENNGKKMTEKEINENTFYDKEWLYKHPEDGYHEEYPDEVIKQFKKAVEIILKAEVYIERIDYLWSGDDGEENFLKRLKKDLKEI